MTVAKFPLDSATVIDRRYRKRLADAALKPFDKLRQTGCEWRSWIVAKKFPRFGDICASKRHVAWLFGKLINPRFFSDGVFNCRDQIFQLYRFAFAKIENVEKRSVVIERRRHALNDVVDVGVIATCRAVTELIDRLARANFLRELVNRQIRPLPRAVDRKETQRDDAHLIKVRVGRAEQFPGNFTRRIGTDCLRDVHLFGERHLFRDAVNRRARSKDETIDASRARGFEQMQRADYVRVVVKLRMMDGGRTPARAARCAIMSNFSR